MIRLTAFSRALLAGAMATAALTACGGQPTPEPVQEPITAGELPTEAAPAVDTTTFVFGHAEDAAKLDPADITDGESLLVTWQMYEGLTRYKPGTTEIEPALAESWEASEDGLDLDLQAARGREVPRRHGLRRRRRGVELRALVRRGESLPQGGLRVLVQHVPGLQGRGGRGRRAQVVLRLGRGGGPADGEADAVAGPTPRCCRRWPWATSASPARRRWSRPATSYGTPDGDPIAVATGPYMVEEWKPGEDITVEGLPGLLGRPASQPRRWSSASFRTAPSAS